MQSMKSSGVEWIGEIPTDWEIIRLKYIANVFNGNSLNDIEKEKFSNGNQGIPYISTKDVEIDFDRIDYDNGIFIPFGSIDYKIALKNNTIICIEGGNAGRKIGFLKNDVCFVNKLCCFEAREKCISKYIYYYTKSKSFSGQFNLSINGLIGGVSIQQLKNFFFIIPPNLKQQEIVYYLDTKCGIIDKAIEKQKKVIEKLKSYKQSLITEAVTKGLKPTVKMKPSGIEWIGDIPEGWEVRKLKYLSKIKTGATPSSDDLKYFDGEYDWFTPSDFNDEAILRNSKRKVSQQAINDNIVPNYPPHSILIIGIGATTGKVGYTISEASSNQQITAVILIKNQLPKYYLFLLISMAEVLKSIALYTTLPILNNATIGQFSLVVPPFPEQQAIVDYLDTKCSEIDNVINSKQKLINKLTDYKKSLIYECVTGKKEVMIND